MPLWEAECLICGDTREMYAPSYTHFTERLEHEQCANCDGSLEPGFSMGKGLTYFSQKAGGRVIHNLGPQPVTITSTKQHERIMREQGVTWATPRRGNKGCWA